jgi:serine/threonine-protein phosphatase 5
VEKTYQGPTLETTDDGKYKITIEFIRSMLQWFKDGKTLPRRYAWEITLGAHDHFVKEESLVDVKVENDATIDVIGDVHGAIVHFAHRNSQTESFCRTTLRRVTPIVIDWGAITKAPLTHEW